MTQEVSPRLYSAHTFAALAVIGAELSPLNELARASAAVAGYNMTENPALSSAAFMAASTLVIEGIAGRAAANLLSTDGGRRAGEIISDKLDKIGIKNIETSPVTNMSISFLAGTAALVGIKHIQDPSMGKEALQNVASKSSLGLSAFFAAETYAISQGFESPSPLTFTLGAAALGAVGIAYKKAKNRLSATQEKSAKDYTKGSTPQKLGLSEADLEVVMVDERTLCVNGESTPKPVLVPVDKLHWFNIDYLEERFEGKKVYYYPHPELSDAEKQEASKVINDELQKNAVIIYDTVTTKDANYGNLSDQLNALGVNHTQVSVSKDGRQRFLPQYEGELLVTKPNKNGYKHGELRTLFDAYTHAIKNGVIKANNENGPAFARVINGGDAEKLWEIYRKPFEKLSHKHPIDPAYKKDDFIQMLADPETVKAVYRENGEICTLAFFVNDISKCDWLEPEYYNKNHSESVEKKNHWIFPGIVTDENKLGASYSLPLIKLIAQVQAYTNESAHISFECTDISYKYVPRIVRYAIRKSGVAKTTGFTEPVARLDYYAIEK